MDIVDKTYNEFKKKALDVLQKYPSSTAFDYIEQCKLDLENFKKYGVFKNPNNETTQSGNVLPVKLERISESSPLTEITSSERVNVENNNDMPPPTEPLKRNRRKQTQVKVEATRVTRNKIKNAEPKRSMRNRQTETDNRDSDVVLQSQEIDTITLSDTEDELNVDSNRPEILENNPNDEEILQTRNTRSTRSTKIKENSDKMEENQKRVRSPSTEDYSKENLTPKPRRTKRVKSDDLSDPQSSVQINSEKGSKVNDQNLIEVIDEVTSKQAALTNETVVINEKVINKVPMNETVVIEKARVIMDKTVVLRKESVLSTAQENNCDDVMTEDESQEETTPVKHNKHKQNAIKNTKPKAIFNNIENSPVKRHIEAFEKLGVEVDSENQKKIKSKLNKKQLEVAEGHLTRSAKAKTKHVFTPIFDRDKTKLAASTIVSNNESKFIISTKSASALKASHQEYTERELKRKEKETEAQRKKEALLQAQIEERRRKREEKQLKAQQTREALVKEKQKTLEYSEKMKEEKYKQVLAEKQEKLAKQREEAEKRRLLASKKALEEKCKEKERRNAIEGDLQTKARNKPKYLTMKTPLLPTVYCYDSDDERSQSNVEKPEWAEWSNLRLTLMHMYYAGDTIKNTFFVCEATTPDLQDIFEYIDPRKLKRTSSAIWSKPPRFTIMPTYFE